MKGYKTFLFVFVVLFILYIVAEVNKPTPINWTVTLSKNDKNPYGSFVLYQQIKNVFPVASVQSFTLPVYDQVNDYTADNTAYLVISNTFDPSKNDWEELKNYVSKGNYVFTSAMNFSNLLEDSLKFKISSNITIVGKDSTAINFVNPSLKSNQNFSFKRQTLDEYFIKLDTLNSSVLGVNNNGKPNFIKIGFGKGAFFIHANPLVFSNYFILFKNNAGYTSKALSYVPRNVDKVYWDEYYKLGPSGASTPLRFFLSNEFLRWALRLSIIGLLLYVLFELKRRQRIIPIISPLKNSTVDFVKTVASVYFNQKDNTSIAQKKIGYFLDFIRQKFYLSTHELNTEFATQLTRKSGVEKEKVDYIMQLIQKVETGYNVNDKLLLAVNQHIDNFYKQVK